MTLNRHTSSPKPMPSFRGARAQSLGSTISEGLSAVSKQWRPSLLLLCASGIAVSFGSSLSERDTEASLGNGTINVE